MAEDEPDIKRENLADSDESPFGDTTEHAGEQDTEKGSTYSDPEGDSSDTEEPRFKGGESDQSLHAGEGEGAETVKTPASEKLANREDV
jgi:hypothetical protein